MRWREFVALLGTGVAGWPLTARATSGFGSQGRLDRVAQSCHWLSLGRCRSQAHTELCDYM